MSLASNLIKIHVCVYICVCVYIYILLKYLYGFESNNKGNHCLQWYVQFEATGINYALHICSFNLSILIYS